VTTISFKSGYVAKHEIACLREPSLSRTRTVHCVPTQPPLFGRGTPHFRSPKSFRLYPRFLCIFMFCRCSIEVLSIVFYLFICRNEQGKTLQPTTAEGPKAPASIFHPSTTGRLCGVTLNGAVVRRYLLLLASPYRYCRGENRGSHAFADQRNQQSQGVGHVCSGCR
jgi:hypothetical protein